MLACAAAIQGAKADCFCDLPKNPVADQPADGGCCIGPIANSTTVPVPESYVAALKTDVNDWGTLVFPGAVVVRGSLTTPESARLKIKMDKYKWPGVPNCSTCPPCGFSPPGIPFIAPGCPPTPTEILNASLPKPSTRPVCPVSRFEGVIQTDCF